MSDDKKKTEPVDEFAGLPTPELDQKPEKTPTAEPKKKRGRKKKTENIAKETNIAKAILSPREKVIAKILKHSTSEILSLDSLMEGKVGTKVKVKDIAIFIGIPEEDVLKEVAKECSLKNTVNLSAEVNLAQVIKVGTQIIENGRMFQPITLARIAETKALECTSGRHRLAFIALMYGADAEIPVYIEDMTLNMARDAVVVSNQSRAVKALEQAEHAAMAAVGGNIDAEQDDLYEKLVKSKPTVGKYCVFSVYDRQHPVKLNFKLAKTQSRVDGGMTTLAIVEAFWKSALEWEKGKSRKEFDESLREATEFLNEFVETIQGIDGFDAGQQLAAKPLVAVGKYYRSHVESANHISAANSIAKQIVSMGGISTQKSEKTFSALCKALQK